MKHTFSHSLSCGMEESRFEKCQIMNVHHNPWFMVRGHVIVFFVKGLSGTKLCHSQWLVSLSLFGGNMVVPPQTNKTLSKSQVN